MLSITQAKELYEYHKANELPRLQHLYNYFIGKHDILNKQDRKGKVDTKAVNNFARYISTIATGYFIGNPVTYVTDEDEFEEMQNVLEKNDEQTVNYNNALNCSIFGKAYELQYYDEKGDYNFIDLDTRNVVVITDGKVKPKITDAILFSESAIKENKLLVKMDIYDDMNVQKYEFIVDRSQTENKNFDYKFISEEAHDFNAVPVVEYKNNNFSLGDYETVISLIDAYNEAVSTNIDDLKDFTDAFLALRNMSGTEQADIDAAKASKTLLLDDDGDAFWLVKNVNDSYSENIKNRIKEDIHKFSFVPDMSDKSFGNNLSGVAIKYKLLALEQLRGQKSRMFKKGLISRLNFMADYLAKTGDGSFAYDMVKVQFNENVPKNLLELADMISKLHGIVPTEYLYSELPFVQDVQHAMELMEKEQSKNVPSVLYEFGNDETKEGANENA